jgi:predicted phage tail protein
MKTYNNIPVIEGDGKGGGGGGGYEAPNTLRGDTNVNLLHLLCEGPIQGLATGDGQSIFIDKTSLQNPNGSYNYKGASWTLRLGTPTQEAINGFANVTSIVAVSQHVKYATPVTVSVSSNVIDAARVTLSFVQGLRQVDDSGNIMGNSVGIKIQSKPHASNTWSDVYNSTKSGKTNGAFEWQIYIPRPVGAEGTTWDIRISRTTADDATAKQQSAFDFVNMVEIVEVHETYDTFAVLGMSLNAQQFGGSIPTVSFLLKGGTIRIPSNYNANTRAYTGVWDGTWTTGYTDNPAFILYDLLTNTQYGGGVYGITDDVVDKYSFYNAAVFNDELVDDGLGGTEPRFNFNAVLMQRNDILSTALQVAGMMNANLFWRGGLLVLNQDRPTTPVMPISKTNVIDGMFTYTGTPLNQRITAVNVAYQDKTNHYFPKVISYSNDSAANTYGFNCVDFAAFGATSEGQAIRAGKWYVYASLNQTESVSFAMGLNGNYIECGDVIALYDEDYTSQAGAGRIVSATANTVQLDQVVTISGASPQIAVLLPDGETFEFQDIITPSGNTSNITIANTFSITPERFCDYIIYSAVAPRTFRITDVKQGSQPHTLEFTGLLYDVNNYSVIESGIVVPSPVYSQASIAAIGEVSNVSITETATNINLGEQIVRGLIISWQPPTQGTPLSYSVDWRSANGIYKTISDIHGQSVDIENLTPAYYDFVIRAKDLNGNESNGVAANYTISTAGSNTSILSAPTSFTVNGSGNVFSSPDVQFSWINPATNDNANTTLKDFVLKITDASGANILQTYSAPAVGPANTQTFLYTYGMNTKDYGSVSRTVYAKVYARDANYNLSTPASNTFINPVPSAMTGNVSALTNQIFIQVDLPTITDFAGIYVWRGTSGGFTPNTSTLVFEGKTNGFTDTNITAGTTYYYKWAAYDTFFAKDYTGAGLNISSAVSATPARTGIPVGAAFPSSGNTDGQLFYNTGDSHLYQYVTANTAWVRVGSDLIANDIKAGMITAGIIGTTELAANSVTATQIAAGAITTSKLSILSGSGTSIDMANGQIIFNNGSFMKVQGTGFGANNQFIEWYGPTNANIANCNAAAAISYLTTTGSAYFGGTLSAGKITNTGQTTNTSNTATIILGDFLTNGNTKNITISFTLVPAMGAGGSTWQASPGTMSASTGGNCTIYLDRSLDSGVTWTNAIATLNQTGSVPTISLFGKGGADIGIWNGFAVSTTITDSSAATSTMQLRGRIGNITYPVVTGTSLTQSGTANTPATQVISIIEVEY